MGFGFETHHRVEVALDIDHGLLLPAEHQDSRENL